MHYTKICSTITSEPSTGCSFNHVFLVLAGLFYQPLGNVQLLILFTSNWKT